MPEATRYSRLKDVVEHNQREAKKRLKEKLPNWPPRSCDGKVHKCQYLEVCRQIIKTNSGDVLCCLSDEEVEEFVVPYSLKAN